MDIHELYKHGQEAARMLFDKTGEIQPMWICITKGGVVMPIVAPMTDKEQLAEALRELFREKQVVCYVSMLECWMLLGKPERTKDFQKYIEGASISQHPERREAVNIVAESKDTQLMGHFFILRPEHGKPTLSPFKNLSAEGAHVEGRFVKMLEDE